MGHRRDGRGGDCEEVIRYIDLVRKHGAAWMAHDTQVGTSISSATRRRTESGMHPLLFAVAMQSCTYVSVPFRNRPYTDGTRLLHTPEQWAAGAGLLGGAPMFSLYDVEPPLVCGAERTVCFRALGQRVRLTGVRLLQLSHPLAPL